jgi:hypothetical protein
MDPIDGGVEQRDAVVRALVQVATGDHTRPLGGDQLAFVDAVRTYLVRSDAPLHDAAPVTPDELARVVAAPSPRDRVVELLTVAPYADDTLDPAKVALVARYAAALGIQGEQLRRRRDAAHRLALRGRLHLARELGPGWEQWHRTHPFQSLARELARGDATRAARFRAMEDLPPDSLGHAFVDFCHNRQYPLPGEPGAAPPTVGLARHDLAHLLAGHQTTPEGELLVSAFLAGNAGRDHLLVAAVGLLDAPVPAAAGVAPPRVPTPEAYWRAVERGTRVRVPLTDAAWDPWLHAAEPLDAVRVEIGIRTARDVVAAEPRVLVGAVTR